MCVWCSYVRTERIKSLYRRIPNPAGNQWSNIYVKCLPSSFLSLLLFRYSYLILEVVTDKWNIYTNGYKKKRKSPFLPFVEFLLFNLFIFSFLLHFKLELRYSCFIQVFIQVDLYLNILVRNLQPTCLFVYLGIVELGKNPYSVTQTLQYLYKNIESISTIEEQFAGRLEYKICSKFIIQSIWKMEKINFQTWKFI